MTTPTATPRTNDGLLAVALACEHCTESVHLYGADMKGHGADIRRVLAELAASKAECERLMNQRDNLLKPLRARAEDRADAADEKVERLTSENQKLTIERDALANGSAIEIARLRADLERADVLYQRSCEVEHALRAEVERLKELLRIESASAQHALAAAERAEAELSDERARLDWLLGSSAQTYHSYSNPLGGGNYVQYHKDRAAIDAAMKEDAK